MNIIIGSKSLIKIKAVEKCFPDAKITGYEVESGVRSQPVGEIETLLGAIRRAYNCKKKFHKSHESKNSPNTYFLGIENGMVKENNVWVDKAAIYIIFPSQTFNNSETLKTSKSINEKGETIWSESLIIPQQNLKNCLNSKGDVIRNWSYLKDPHIIVTEKKKSRQQFLENALKQSSILETFYKIEFNLL